MSNNEAKNQASDISNLQQSFSKQQKKISALKELLRKSEVAHGRSTSTAQEKVKNIAQRLTLLKSKAKSRQGANISEMETDLATANVEQLSPDTTQILHAISLASPEISTTPTVTPLNLPHPREGHVPSASAIPATTPGSEKILLLRQQMEENKLRMAQRASSKLHLEQLVTQIREKFDSTQQCLADTTELGKSMGDLSALSYVHITRERHKSATDLSQQPFSLEKERIKFLDNRCRLLEMQLDKERQSNANRDTSLNESTALETSSKQIKELENKVLELQNMLQERESEIEVNTREKNSYATDNARILNEMMAKDLEMQELQLNQEKRPDEGYKSSKLENENLRQKIKEKLARITELEQRNEFLEAERSEFIYKQRETKNQLQEVQEELSAAKNQLQQERDELEETRTRLVKLEYRFESRQDSTEVKENVDRATDPDSDTEVQVKAEMAKQIQELHDDIQQLRRENLELRETLKESEKLVVSDASIAEKIAALEATIESQRDDLKQRVETVSKQEEELMEKTIELNVLNANFKVLEEKLEASSKNKSLFSASTADKADNPELQAEVQQLKHKLDESNKAMIKLKLKSKQTEKQMEKLKKSSDLHAEVVKLGKMNEELQQKITELEDEKGQWELTDVGSDNSSKSLIVALEDKCELQKDTIRLLEQQKFEQLEQLQTTQQELQALQLESKHRDSEESARVKSEMCEINLEEQLEQQTQQIASLQEQLKAEESVVQELKQQLQDLQLEKQAMEKKMELYMTENMDLLDKVEKLSKSSSSAESIEIVERLTQQERAEIDEFNKQLHQSHTAGQAPSLVSELTQTEMGHELSENLVKLREESSELMKKIELFTTERREVLEKMENLTAENQELTKKIEEITKEKETIVANTELVESAKSKLELQLVELTKEKDILAVQVAESTAQKSKLSQELTSLQTSSEVMAALDSSEGATLFDKCEKSLSKLNSELEAYHKADRNAKFNASKKLAKEAKNVHRQLTELLHKVKEASTAVETVTVVETVVAVTAPNGKALAEYEQLTSQNRQLKATIEELRREMQDVHETVHVSTADTTDVPAIALPQTASTDSQEKLVEALEKLHNYEEQCVDLQATATANQEKLQEALGQLHNYEEQCVDLQSTVETLRLQLQEARLAGEERSAEVSNLSEELQKFRKMSEDFDRLLSDKDLSYGKQVEQLTRLRRDLEGQCSTYEGEMEILQTLVTEQKQQLIESYKEQEHEMNLKLLDLQQRDEEINKLRSELIELRQSSVAVGNQLSEDLQKECEKLRDSLKINKALVTEQVNELSNKQESIDTLNQQITELYRTMEDNTTKVIEKEDEIAYLQETVDTHSKELDRLRKDNDEQKSVVDKLLNELHSHKANTQHLPQLESNLQRLEQTNKELDQRNKDLLEKLKKYAANLKKRTVQCQELDAKIKGLEKGALEQMQSKEARDDIEQELQELTANNLLLNDRSNQLEKKLAETEAEAQQVQEALQAKTLELLEKMESNAKLEYELKQVQESLAAKKNETMDLQKKLSDSQAHSEDTLQATNAKELEDKDTMIAQLQEHLKHSRDEVSSLRTDLLAAQAEMSGLHGDILLQSSKREDLARDLEQAKANLEYTSAELLRMREEAKEMQQANGELQSSFQQKRDLAAELQLQIANMFSQPSDTQALQEKVQTQEQRLAELTEDLKAKAIRFEKCKAVIKERNHQIQRLQGQVKELQANLSAEPEEHIEPAPQVVTQLDAAPSKQQVSKKEYDALQLAYDKLSESYAAEKSNFKDTVTRLETLHDGIQAKLQEDMSYIESLEQENSKFKEKNCRLEDCVANFEERRASMERNANILDAQMQTRANEYEKTEDELIYRLNMLSEHDDIIAQRLLDSQEEKDVLQDRVDRLQTELKELNAKYTKVEKDYQTYQETTESKFESETATLREQLGATEQELQHQRAVYDAKLAAKATELEELECELGDQLHNINADKRAIAEDLERSRDECSEQKDEIVRLRESLNALEQAKHELDRETTWLRMQNESSQQDQYEMQELRMQTMQDKTEIDNLRHQIETLAANHELELQALRTQISELDTVRMQVGQNQTDDQVFIETENKRLTDLLAEKEVLIENYQRQNLQLQMAAAASAPPVHSQTDALSLAFGLPPQPQSQIQSGTHNDERERLEKDLVEQTQIATRLQVELQALVEGNIDLQRQLLEKEREIDQLRSLQVPQNDIIPAPPMYFASEQVAPSPFDDIVAIRSIEHTLDAVPSNHDRHNQELNIAGEQPTIEDLQRNVSDLEKHAQDLESKLVIRNQRLAEYEERLRDMQNRLPELELYARDREQKLQRAQQELGKLEEQIVLYKETQTTSQQHLEQLQNRMEEQEIELMGRNEKVTELELKLQLAASQTTDNQQVTQANTDALNRLEELERNLQQAQTLLQARDQLVEQLKHELNNEKNGSHRKQSTVRDLESQIIPSAAIADSQTAVKPTLEMFFGGSSAPEFENLIIPQLSAEPVVEEMIIPEKAYICHPKDAIDQDPAIAGFELSDDWGDTWGGSEAAAEAAHFTNTKAAQATTNQSLISREHQLEIRLQEETERIQELELALERCEEHKQELQLKSGKLMKKLKEYKNKIDELNSKEFRKSSSVESNSLFNDLDATIQDELKSQIKKLESKVEEQHKVQENSAAEKEKLLKRIDMLVAGNERMSEMKERQDMDVQMYQSRIRDLQGKLHSLEDWGAEDGDAGKKEDVVKMVVSSSETLNLSPSTLGNQLEQKIAELTAELKDLNGDRQELQALLEDEKANAARSEEKVASLRLEISTLENAAVASESSAKSKQTALQLELQQVQETNKTLETELQSVKAEHEQQLQQLQTLELKVNAEAASAESNSKQLLEELQKLRVTEQQFNEVQAELLELKTCHQELTQANEELKSSPGDTSSDYYSLELTLQALLKEQEQWRLLKATLEKQVYELQFEVSKLQLMPSGSGLSSNSDELAAQLQVKDSEIMHLRQRNEDLIREDQTEKLVLEILGKNQEIHMLKMQVKHLEDDKQELEHNLTVQITTDMQAGKADAEQAASTQLQQQVQKMELQVRELLAEKENMEEELKVLNNHVMSSLELEDKLRGAVLDLDMKNIEISELRTSLQTIKCGTSEAAALDVDTLNAQWEAIVEQKCAEIAQMWRDHLDHREREFKMLEARFHEEIGTLRSSSTAPAIHKGISAETTATSTTGSESTSASGSSSAAVSKAGTPLHGRIIDEQNEADTVELLRKMQMSLEQQEIEIITLKEQLAIRSAEYARLAAQYDPFKLQTTLSHSGMSTAPPITASSLESKRSDDATFVPKSEFDLALYMLHQRDMRCEEMTVELLSLLDERDTLQLKLSNTLRQVEAIKAQTNYVEPPSSQTDAGAMETQDQATAAASTGDSSDELNEKLSQLQSVKHSKDKSIKEERDQRIRQMEKIQQDVAKMPTAAVSELVGADLSNSSQSPSTVLMNWLWGGTKPHPSADGAPPN